MRHQGSIIGCNQICVCVCVINSNIINCYTVPILNEFDILKPRKTRKGDRLFRVEDIKNLQIIYFLLRQKKYSIEGARTYLKQNKSQADTQAQLVQTLTKFKTFLLELKTGLH